MEEANIPEYQAIAEHVSPSIKFTMEWKEPKQALDDAAAKSAKW